jgi:hypothetical protein
MGMITTISVRAIKTLAPAIAPNERIRGEAENSSDSNAIEVVIEVRAQAGPIS